MKYDLASCSEKPIRYRQVYLNTTITKRLVMIGLAHNFISMLRPVVGILQRESIVNDYMVYPC